MIGNIFEMVNENFKIKNYALPEFEKNLKKFEKKSKQMW